MPQSIRGRSFIRSWIYAITLITGSVIAAALIIDPYGISPLNLSIPGINETRTERTSIDRLIKPVEVMLRQPRTVILGTSRVKQGLDPSVFQGTPDWPAYNLGMDFSGPAETILFMEKLLPRIDALKKVFIEININHFYFIRPPVVDLSWSALAGKVIKMVFTLDALKAAARTIVRNRSYEGHPWWLRQDGVTGHVPDRFLNQDVPNFLANVLPGWNAEYSLGNNQAKALDRIAALCRDNGWECVYFIAPYHPYDLVATKLSNDFESYQAVKRYFVKRGETLWDFTAFNRFTEEPVSEKMEFWSDINHFKMNVGGWMLEIMSGRRRTGLPDNFGVRLTPDNVEGTAQHWQSGLAAWMAEHNKETVAIQQGLEGK